MTAIDQEDFVEIPTNPAWFDSLPSEGPCSFTLVSRIDGINVIRDALAKEEESPVVKRCFRAVELRFGIECDERTYAAVGAHFGVGTERARQLVLRGLRCLRHPVRIGGRMQEPW